MAIAVNIVFMAFYCVPGVAATVIVDDDNYVTEIRSLFVPSYGTYNVEFYNGSYAEIWGTGFDFPGSYVAVEAVCGALNDHETIPTLILYEDLEGNPYLPFGAFHMPYEYTPGPPPSNPENNVRVRVGSYMEFPDDSGIFIWRNSGLLDRGKTQATLYAKFSQVPIPGAVWLLGSGLVGLICLRKKFKK
jgi:hypothetical protein